MTAIEQEHHAGSHELPPLEDPGKRDRAAHGVPVVPVYDGYRAYAILLIAIFHVCNAAGVTTSAGGGWGGQLIWGTFPHFVDILFILSGFVVFLPTVAREGEFGTVGSYAIRRAARLLPAFWFVLVICFALIELLPSYTGAVPGVDELALNFSGQHQVANLFDNGYLPGFGVDLPMWTLTLEIGFYVVLAIVATSYFRHPFAGLAIAAAISIAWRLVFDHLGYFNDLLGLGMSTERMFEVQIASAGQLPSWAFSFGAGMFTAWAYVRLRARHSRADLRRIASPIAVAALCTLAIFAYLAGRYAITEPFPIPAVVARQSSFINLGYTASLATLMLSLAFAPWSWQRPFAHPLVRRLGDISYGVYLIHSVIIFAVLVEFAPLNDGSLKAFLLWALIVLPPSLGFGYLSARFLEQPIRRWARRFGRRAQAPTASAATAARALQGKG